MNAKENKETIQSYINNFRRQISQYLRPGIGIECTAHPAQQGGGVLVFRFGIGVENIDDYKKATSSLSSALSGIEQHAFGGNLKGFTFKGTNLLMEKDKIILIKDEEKKEWSSEAALKDIHSILRIGKGENQ